MENVRGRGGRRGSAGRRGRPRGRGRCLLEERVPAPSPEPAPGPEPTPAELARQAERQELVQSREVVVKQYKRRRTDGTLPGVPETTARRRQSALPLDRASVLPLPPGTPAELPCPLPPPWARPAPSATSTRTRSSGEAVSPAPGPSRVSEEEEDFWGHAGHSSADLPSRHLSGWAPRPLQMDMSSYSHLPSEAATDPEVASPAAVMKVDAARLLTWSSTDIFDNSGSDVDAEDQVPDDIDVDLVLAGPPTLATDSPAVLDMDPIIMTSIAQMDRQNDIAMRATLPMDRISFNWRSDMAAFTGVREEFTGTPGPTFPMSEIRSPVDVFLKIWDQEIMSLIVRETNEYAAQWFDRRDVSASSRRWQPTSVNELYVFFAVMIVQSQLGIPVESEYFYSPYRIAAMPFFKEYFPYNRYLFLKKFIHFVKNDNISESLSLNERKVHKIQPINTHLNRKFQDLYLPGQNVTVAESLLKWRKRHRPLRYSWKIAAKAAKTGFKSYELCDSDTGYLWKFFIYAGKSATTDSQSRDDMTDQSDTTDQSDMTDQPDMTNQPDMTDQPDRTDYQPAGAAAKIVYDLASPLFGKGYSLVMENFYSSPLLARSLKLRGTDCYGTVRLDRENVPDSMKYLIEPQMRKGDIVASTSGDINVIVWKDADLVSMVSTYHKVEAVATKKYGLRNYTPQVVLDYNQAMGGVDKMNQMLANFPFMLRDGIWYKKVFRRLLNISLQNAFIINRCNDKSITYRKFRLLIFEGLLKSFWHPSVPPQIPTAVQDIGLLPSRLRNGQPRLILQDNHFCVKITQGPLRRSCVWCADYKNKRSRTTWMCDVCEVPLCIECMRPYHTEE